MPANVTSDGLLPPYYVDFPSTQWLDIEAAAHPNPARSAEALDRLVRHYQAALLAYLEHKFLFNEYEASDWLQDFLTAKVVEKNLFTQVKRIRGRRFRSYLLCTLHNFITSRVRIESGPARMPSGGFTSFESVDDFESASVRDEAMRASELEWAREVLAEALDQMEDYCRRERRQDLWGIFEGRVKAPILDGAIPVPYDELVQKFNLESPVQAYNLLQTGKRLCIRCLESVVGEYASSQPEVECELRALQTVLVG